MPTQTDPGRLARWIDALAGDLRFALRYFARHKGTTAIILVVLALGTGANTMIFSMFQAEFLRPAPAMPADDALARIWSQERPTMTGRWDVRTFSQAEFGALAERREVFQAVGAWVGGEAILDGGDSSGARGVVAQFVTPNYFGVIQLPLAAGQGFLARTDDTPDMTAVMSYAMAELLYGNAAAAVGKQIEVNEIPVVVSGVTPPRFQGAVRYMDEPALWLPLSARADIARVSPRWLTEDASLELFARLAPGASREQAAAIAQHIVTTALPDSAARVGMTRSALVLAMNQSPSGVFSNATFFAFIIMSTIGILILLVAWMNVSSLMVAAAVARRHEISVRLSLGASRLRLMRQLVTESTLLALVGSAAGLLVAYWQLTYMMSREIDGVDIAPDAGTFGFVLLMALGTGILFGLSPALHATRGGVANALRESGSGATHRSRLQRGFVVAQIALSQPLLVLLGTMLSLVIADYQPMAEAMSTRVIAAGFRPLAQGAPGQRPETVDTLIRYIAGRPDVVGAVPEVDGIDARGVIAPDRLERGARADTVSTTIVHLEGAAPGWFALLDVPILIGRDVALADTMAEGYPVVIGSDLARALWGTASPIGRTLASPPMRGYDQDSITMTVVGVYDAAFRTTRGSNSNGVSRAYTARGRQWSHDRILVRTRGPAEPFVQELQRFVRDRAPSLPVTSMRTLAQISAEEQRTTLRVALAAAAGGVVALLLASLGLYGVVSLAVRQRTREIGIRIAVGAHPMRVARMFLASGVRASMVALALGLPLSIIALKVGLEQRIVIAPNVNPYVIGGAIALILMGVAAAATWVPARRAALVDPATTLRTE